MTQHLPTLCTGHDADGRPTALVAGRLDDPFAFLGRHCGDGDDIIRVFMPGARTVTLINAAPARATGRHAHLTQWPMEQAHPGGVFIGHIPTGTPYRLRVAWDGGMQETEDAYAFGPLLGDFDLHLISHGEHQDLYRVLGAHVMDIDGVAGVRFAVWAPNARHVSVVGNFNMWDGRRHPMRLRHDHGIWELFIPRIGAGEAYKFEICDAQGRLLPLKADPLAFAAEVAPATASIVVPSIDFDWSDDAWMRTRDARQDIAAPVSIYEVHAGSWRHTQAGHVNWDELRLTLLPYVLEMGFTHIELLPIAEYPFGGSWGYQPLGLFAPSARFGPPDHFARFVNACHMAGVGIILDWVPAHFPTDPHGLARFDGSALYEHADPREGYHPDWNTLIYNNGRREVSGFLIASALFWLRQYHIDALRVDAVASMLYRDYSRGPGTWVPNIYGGRENLETIAFLRHLNATIAVRCPGAITIAEESTQWPGVTRAVSEGGLGFTFKWNMGWMHDTLDYMGHDPMYRRYHHNEMTFGLLYGFSEHFILPLSHDEVVHGKGSLLRRMPGDTWQKHANLRAYLAFMWGHPGKKLLFMGGELAQQEEWNHAAQLAWQQMETPEGNGVRRLVQDLNHLYRTCPALHLWDSRPEGFVWLIGDDRENSVFAWARQAAHGPMVMIVCNMTPVPRHGYRIGVPHAGTWREILNTDASLYGGSNMGNYGAIQACPDAAHGHACSVTVLLPPLGTLFFQHEGDRTI
ncbi:1,4-alpha-glucan branching protein GlgB [Novacetimonas hansenii]|uniref:1,4-alpha-glucan branching enzyme GlgB n=1 Tax=Novacetimonas hansenii TaxID=436 RepID=A0AAW5EPN2_NOVHA|nr:1,4-alpha-glucan branching protein GlgB [Novacetimonas hansenii]MCJ8353732.1 1,4-alpha-glucan branching protein GlgB [Novacetimonas hansenii]